MTHTHAWEQVESNFFDDLEVDGQFLKVSVRFVCKCGQDAFTRAKLPIHVFHA